MTNSLNRKVGKSVEVEPTFGRIGIEPFLVFPAFLFKIRVPNLNP